jgi:superoxide reductase
LNEEPKDVGAEKHVPVLEKTEKGFKVKVGSVPHPMEETHFIEWIELRAGDEVCKKFLKPGDAPEAEFELEGADLSDVKAREYCTIHGLWRS